MTKRMLIDSTHSEETRVVVLDGNRLEDFDVETSTKQHLKGNVYLAKIVRVEPSLQAAFVEFGGGRHGFLAFGEIHPDYYQIPVADRKRLLEMQEAEAREDEEADEREAASQERGRTDRGRQDRGGHDRGRSRRADNADAAGTNTEADASENAAAEGAAESALDARAPIDDEPVAAAADALIEAGFATDADPEAAETALPHPSQVAQPAAMAQEIIVAPEEARALFADPVDSMAPEHAPSAEPTGGGEVVAPEVLVPMMPDAASDAAVDAPTADGMGEANLADEGEAPSPAEDAMSEPGPDGGVEVVHSAGPPEAVGGEQDGDERADRRSTPRFLRNYKIQEVMRRRQILLVQVVKEERGTKGAALTTYISLAGRFSVLMPNSPRGGGISRKITSMADRRRLKEVMAELDLPRGMGLIVRTAGANRPKPEIIRDCEYLLNQWDQIRDLTMKSMAPALIYEEANLIKRAIRDVYSRDVDDILVDGEAGWRAARDFMRMLMPTHAKKVQLWKEPQPLFAKAQVELQLDAMLQPSVQLRSGGYLVINQTEALVAIDVNSGRGTRERGIEETALKTNLEAAEEAARQLRLRDLAGLIVIDFIDMESRRNIAAVEKKLKDALKNDRARIQVGSISHFGLLEMSRQRLRPSLAETSFVTCAHCGGAGHVRSTENAALHVLRGIEDEGAKRRAAEVVVHVAGSIALYILNHKRVRLGEIEQRFGLHVTFASDDSLMAPEMRIERVRAQTASEGPAPISQLAPPEPFEDPDEEVLTETVDEAAEGEAASEGEGEGERQGGSAAEASDETREDGEQRKRRRRRRRGGRRDEAETTAEAAGEAGQAAGDDAATDDESDEADAAPRTAEAATPGAAEDEAATEDGERKRRGRRGGRRRRRGEPVVAGEDAGESTGDAGPNPVPAYATPASSPPTYTAPAYVGPTPADPFGGSNAFDFFDAVEQAEQARIAQPVAIMAAPPPLPEPDMGADAAEEAPFEQSDAATPEPAASEDMGGEASEPATDAGPSMIEPDMPVAADSGPMQNEPDARGPTASESAEPELALAGPDEDDAPTAPVQPTPDPMTTPMMIGQADGSPAEKKRGWWRR